MFSRSPEKRNSSGRKAGRLLDGYLSPGTRGLVSWDSLRVRYGLANVRGSMFLRPYSVKLKAFEPARLGRITRAIRKAA